MSIEHRREPRFLCRGEIWLALRFPEPIQLKANLVDISNNGFRAAYEGCLLPANTEIHFRHHLFLGRARVVWSQQFAGRSQSGFMVIRD